MLIRPCACAPLRATLRHAETLAHSHAYEAAGERAAGARRRRRHATAASAHTEVEPAPARARDAGADTSAPADEK